MMNLINKPFVYITGILGLNVNDILLSSFPRSGNTWMRFLIANYISVVFEKRLEITFPVLDRMMPEIGVSNMLKSWPYDGFPRIVKTHWPYYYWLFKKCRSIGIIRDPRDVMISYYRYLTKRDNPLFEGDFQSFIQSNKFGLINWFQHTCSWLKHWDLVVRYEDLRKDTEKECRRTFHFLGANFDDEMLTDIITRANIRRIAESEKYAPSEGFRNDSVFRFVRNGGSRQWKDFFDGKDVDYFNYLNKKFNLDLYG